MRTTAEIQNDILALEKELNVKNPHRMNEISVEMSILLGDLVGPLSRLQRDYSEKRSTAYRKYLSDGMKPTPAEKAADHELEVVRRKLDIEYIKEFIRTRERTINRIENYLSEHIKLQTRGV